MTRSRREMYRKSAFDRWCKFDIKRRKKELRRRIRRMPMGEVCTRDEIKAASKAFCDYWW